MDGVSGPPAAGGVLESHDDLATLRFERLLAHPVERVWAALTDPRQLVRWWGEAQVELSKGGSFVMSWLNTDDEGNTAVMHGTITALEPPRLLEISGDIHGVLRFELHPQHPGTRLTFSATVRLPDEFRTKVLAGWHFHLDALAAVLAGGFADLVRLPGWEQIHRRYVAQIPPPATGRAVRALYFRLLESWNRRSGAAYADCFADDGTAIGFDGSQHTGRVGIGSQMQAIFDDHPTASYVAAVRRIRMLGPDAAVLWAIAGLVPPGQPDIKPELNALQTLTAERRDGEWRIVLFQNTPAQFHGRPELAQAMTEELRRVLRGPQK